MTLTADAVRAEMAQAHIDLEGRELGSVLELIRKAANQGRNEIVLWEVYDSTFQRLKELGFRMGAACWFAAYSPMYIRW